MKTIRLAIAGVGNCARSLLQGIEYYRTHTSDDTAGLIHKTIGGYRLEDVQVVAAFDVDRRKVGKPLEDAVFAPPNCTTVFHRELPSYGVTVQMGAVLDGVADHMGNYPDGQAFRVADEEPCDTARVLKDSGAEVLVLICLSVPKMRPTITPKPVWTRTSPWSTACPCSSLRIPSGASSFARETCPSSVTTSRASSVRPSFTGC